MLSSYMFTWKCENWTRPLRATRNGMVDHHFGDCMKNKLEESNKLFYLVWMIFECLP